MPDTQANQAVYPQSGEQQPGLGFPLAMLAEHGGWICSPGSINAAAPTSAKANVWGIAANSWTGYVRSAPAGWIRQPMHACRSS